MKNILVQQTFESISDELDSIYKKRRHAQLFQKIIWFLTGLFFVAMFLNMLAGYFSDTEFTLFSFFRQFNSLAQHRYANIYPFVGLVVLLYPAIYFFTNSFRKFKIKETETIAKMVKLLFPKVEFTQSTAVPKKEIENSKLFAWVNTETRMYSYGQIKSSTSNTKLNIYDVGIIEQHAGNKIIRFFMGIPYLNILAILYQYVLKNIVSNKTADNVHFTFRGMFSWLHYPKRLNGHTVVLTKSYSTKLNRLASFKFNEEQKVVLEDPRFIKEFMVYSTDQVEARYVLSTALMEHIVALKEKFNRDIALSFHNQQMYFAVENPYGLFAFSSGKLNSVNVVEELANDIETALNVAENLHFNYRVD
ncbi:DUF3137 domain-containing protein [uncultured Winogradskyella sp.]|uniref:DUF3137 domain-containing protein n=1 Tax=uncultured Winogradskyella sp. TaxID=395353 RepID=UPI002617684E|nr:DUF3137 domain-containing protein [uncultured Winogradskyella sp.]